MKVRSMAYETPKSVAELTSLAVLSPLVIATRMTNLWLSMGSPTGQSCREVNLMVTEKIEALAESAFAVNLTLAHIGLESALRPLQAAGGAAGFLRGMDEVAVAGLRPYTRKVRANRKRLAQL